MSERPRVPVEPLSDRRWQEIRRNVLAEAALASAPQRPPTRASSRAPLYVATFAAAALAIVLVWTGEARETSATALSRVVTDDSSATASAGDATVGLAAHTSVLIIERASDAWVVSLESGSTHFDVPSRGDRPAFTVEAGRTRVQVIGTAFTVTRAPGAASAEVVVEHGAVHVTDGSVDVVLHDGERWPAQAPSASREPVASPVDAVTATEPAALPEEAAATPLDTASTSPPVAALPIAAPSRPAESSARDRYRDAVAREAREPAAALAIYAELAGHPGPWSAPALFSQARLEAELGHAAQARELAQTYLARHPAGINAQDARDLLHDLH